MTTEHISLRDRIKDSIKAKSGASIHEEFDQPNKYAIHYSFPSDQSRFADKKAHGYAAIKGFNVVGRDTSLGTATTRGRPSTLREWLSDTGIDNREGF